MPARARARPRSRGFRRVRLRLAAAPRPRASRRPPGAPCALVAALCAWSACAAIPPAPLDPHARAEALLARSLTASELVAFAAAIDAPSSAAPGSADALTTAAFYFQPRVRMAAAEARRARSAIATSRALPNPTLSIAPEYAVNPARGESPWSPALQFEWPLTSPGKRSHAIDRATAEALAAHYAFAAELAGTERSVHGARRELTAATSAALGLQAEADVARALAEAWRARVAVGAASAAAAAPAEAAALAANAALADARERESLARAALADAVGVSLEALARVPLEPAVDGEPRPVDPTLGEALPRRPDVLSALASYAAAEAALQAEIARQFPDLRIGSGYQWDQGQSKFMLGLSLDLPLLDRNAGPIGEALALRERAAAAFDAVQSAALAEIERARAQREAARTRAATTRAARDLLAAEAARAEAARAAGAANRVDALAARGLALAARRADGEAELALRAATESLALALAPAREDAELIADALASEGSR